MKISTVKKAISALVIAIALAAPAKLAFAGCGYWGGGDGCERDDDSMRGYDYNQAFNSPGFYSGTYTSGEFTIDTFFVQSEPYSFAGYQVSIYYDENGNDSGSTINRGGCITQFDNEGQQMGEPSGSC